MPHLLRNTVRVGCVRRMYSWYGVPYFRDRHGIEMAEPVGRRRHNQSACAPETLAGMGPLAVLATAQR